jgi:DNA-binding NtrC family response regulator
VVIEPDDLWPPGPAIVAAGPSRLNGLLDLPFNAAVSALERELIRRALEASSGNRTDAARRLQINRRLLYSKMREHELT